MTATKKKCGRDGASAHFLFTMVGETTPLIITPSRTLNEEEDDEHKRRYVVSSLELEDDNAVVVAHSYHCLKNTALLTLLCGVVVIVIAAVSNLQDAPFLHDYSSAAVNYLFSSRPYKWLPLTPAARLGRVRNSTANGNRPSSTETSVAFLGNSMLYFNDLPRFIETIAGGRVVQNSCLHGSASIATLLDGSGMYPKFKTHNAILGKDKYGQYIHDYGACTVSQLLLGQDVQLNNANNDKGGGQQQQLTTTNSKNVNPCNADIAYREYNTYIINQQQSRSMTDNVAVWDYVVINDNTLHPARHETRYQSLRALEQYYLPWLLETKSIPVFIWTYAYSRADNSMSCDDGGGGGGDNTSGSSRSRTRTKESRDMTGLEDIAKFTHLTGTGYEEYAKLLATHLPTTQVPRIAPVGLAYLAVHDENYEVWQSLFHCDGLHASPAGTFLQGCIIYYTLFGVMPNKDVVLRENMSTLWTRSRMMQHAWDPPNPYPDKSMATYLYEVAERIMVEGYMPKSYSYSTQ